MNRTTTAFVIVLGLLAAPAVEATVSLTKRNHFDLNWYFQNTSTVYPSMDTSVGYYRDYNNDGLPDFFIVLKDPQTRSWRMLALDTRPTGTAKTYANRTASRDIAPQRGIFTPYALHTPFAPSMESPDLVVVGTNDATTGPSTGPFSRFTFWRLNKMVPSLPTEATWFTDVATSFSPRLYWPGVSFNGDDYPDYLIYNTVPTNLRLFVVRCCDGRNGNLIWSRTLAMDPADPGTGILGGGSGLFANGSTIAAPYLSVSVLPHRPADGLVGDFDGNGKPEVFLYYTFGRGSTLTTFSVVADVNLLNSGGGFVAPYSSAWTRVFQVPSIYSPPASIVTTDYNRDRYVDLLLLSQPGFSGPLPAVFEGYSLKTRQSLFQSNNYEFGKLPSDQNGFIVSDQRRAFTYHPGDINGDRWNDLDVYRTFGQAPSWPLRVGFFNAYAGGGLRKGRQIWLGQFDNFNRAVANVNDFDGNGLMDFVLLREPDQPDTPVTSRVTWRFAYTAVSATGLTLVKQFDYVTTQPLPFNPATDLLSASAEMISGFGDVDGDGRQDTAVCMYEAIDIGRDMTWELLRSHVLVYDNTPGAARPDMTAELEIAVLGENWLPVPFLLYATALEGKVFVDNNRDGFANDVIVNAQRAIFSLSFQYRVRGGPPRLQAAVFQDLDGNGPDIGDHLTLTLDRSVVVTTSVLRASHFFLPVAGNSLGTAGFRADVNPYDTRQIVLTLGQGSRLTVPGVFSMARRTSGWPSGMDFATSLPVGAIRSLDGLSAVDGGVAGVNDSGVDIRYSLIGTSRVIGARGGTAGVAVSSDAAYTGHQVVVPYRALSSSATFTLSQPAKTLGVPDAVRVASNIGTLQFRTSATLSVQYRDDDIDWELGFIEGEMRVHQLVENPRNVFRYIPLPGKHTVQGTVRTSAAGSTARKLATPLCRVSVPVGNLNPYSTLGATSVFAGLPIETVDERTINMKPGGSGIIKGSGDALLTPGPLGAYTLHKIEFPTYVTTTESDPTSQRLTVKIRTATLAERLASGGGQSFPDQSGAVFVVVVTDSVGAPVQFTDPVNVTVQFKERPDPSLTDTVDFLSLLEPTQYMQLVRDTLDGEPVSFAYQAAPQTINTAQGTLTAQNVPGLTGPSGVAAFGAVARRGATPARRWQLYR